MSDGITLSGKDISPLHCANAEVNNLRIRPIRLMSFTTPHPTNAAQAPTAEAKSSGVVSDVKAGVRAAVIGA
jgi:hypothetical protein